MNIKSTEEDGVCFSIPISLFIFLIHRSQGNANRKEKVKFIFESLFSIPYICTSLNVEYYYVIFINVTVRTLIYFC